MKNAKLFVLIASGTLVVVLAVAVAIMLFSLSSKLTPAPVPAPTPADNPPNPAPPNPAPPYITDGNDDGSDGISVSGTGMVNVNPDVAYISLGVSTRGTDPKAVIDENNKLIDAVIQAVLDKGIAEKDTRTTDFNMYPDYNYMYDEFGKEIRGYSVSNNVSVVVRDITIVGEVLGAAADAGANVSGGVQFGLIDNSMAYNDALVLAIKNAVGKAEAIAGALGKTIGNPSSVVESVSYYSPYYADAVNWSVNEAEGSVPVQSGKLTVTANVQMVYDYIG